VGTERAWSRCDGKGIPRLIFINKMERENADFNRSLDSVQANFGRRCLPFQVPIGAEQSCTGVVDLLNLERSSYLVEFVDQMTRINRGRVVYTSRDKLGEYILVDYLTSRRKQLA